MEWVRVGLGGPRKDQIRNAVSAPLPPPAGSPVQDHGRPDKAWGTILQLVGKLGLSLQKVLQRNPSSAFQFYFLSC